MQDRIVRHAGVDRLIHWLAAVCVLVLMATAFLPILGLEFAWVSIHWWAGLALMAVVLVHIVRSLLPRRFVRIWIGPRDLGDALAVVRRTLRLQTAPAPKTGKYSFAQKFIHLAFATVVLAAIGSGALLMVKTDTPWWDRNPYWLSDDAWGIVYVIHGSAALLLITMVMTHVYFALRPEKWMFLRSMIRGWITAEEFSAKHDPARWTVEDR
jgi:cytochrome b subunit of formate dehydrogenase